MSFPARILYVDDEPANIEMMKYWLREHCSYDLTTAADGREASEYIEKGGFNLYLIDYCLPDTTATRLCRSIRQHDAKVPIIIYSALDRDIDKQNAIKAGADVYLVKPDDIHLIEPNINRLLASADDGVRGSASVRRKNVDPSGPRRISNRTV